MLSFGLDLASLWYGPLVGSCEGLSLLCALAKLDLYKVNVANCVGISVTQHTSFWMFTFPIYIKVKQ
jgi:hypothetical protein